MKNILQIKQKPKVLNPSGISFFIECNIQLYFKIERLLKIKFFLGLNSIIY